MWKTTSACGSPPPFFISGRERRESWDGVDLVKLVKISGVKIDGDHRFRLRSTGLMEEGQSRTPVAYVILAKAGISGYPPRFNHDR